MKTKQELADVITAAFWMYEERDVEGRLEAVTDEVWARLPKLTKAELPLPTWDY